MRLIVTLFALLMFMCPPASAQSLAGIWQTVGDDGLDAELTLNADGSFVITSERPGSPSAQSGVWQRRGDVVIFSSDPLDAGPAYRLLSTEGWTKEAEQEALSTMRAAMNAQALASCPWLKIPDVASRTVASGDAQISSAQAHETLKEVRLAAEALSVAAQRAAPNDGYANREAIHHAIAAAKRYAEAWGNAKAMYSAAGLPLPERPLARVPDSCHPKEASVDPDLVAVHLISSDGSQIDLSDDLTVAFRKPLGERQELLGANNWSFTSGGKNGPIEAITFLGAGIPAGTVAIRPEDGEARIFTIEINLQALASGPKNTVAQIRDDSLFMYGGRVRFVRNDKPRAPQLPEEQHDTELSVRLSEAGTWPDAARGRLLRASDDPQACAPGGVSMAPSPSRPAALGCEVRSDPENRFVAVDIGVPDGDMQPDGITIAAMIADGKRIETTIRSGTGLLAVMAGTSLTKLQVVLPDGRSTTFDLPEQWRNARYFRLTLPRAMLR